MFQPENKNAKADPNIFTNHLWSFGFNPFPIGDWNWLADGEQEGAENDKQTEDKGACDYAIY